MRISDWSSDVCSSDLFAGHVGRTEVELRTIVGEEWRVTATLVLRQHIDFGIEFGVRSDRARLGQDLTTLHGFAGSRSEEHTSELQSLMRISYAVFCLKKKKNNRPTTNTTKTTHNQH